MNKKKALKRLNKYSSFKDIDYNFSNLLRCIYDYNNFLYKTFNANT